MAGVLITTVVAVTVPTLATVPPTVAALAPVRFVPVTVTCTVPVAARVVIESDVMVGIAA